MEPYPHSPQPIPPAEPLDPLLVSWTRALLWITIVCSALHLLTGIGAIIAQVGQYRVMRAGTLLPSYWRMTPEFLFFCLGAIGPQVLAILAAKSCFALRPRPRVTLIVAMWLWIGVGLLSLRFDFRFSPLWALQQIADTSTLPAIVLLFLSRPVVKRLFASDTDRAFEPVLPGQDTTREQSGP